MIIIASVGEEGRILRKYERMGFSGPILPFISRCFAPRPISPCPVAGVWPVNARLRVVDLECEAFLVAALERIPQRVYGGSQFPWVSLVACPSPFKTARSEATSR